MTLYARSLPYEFVWTDRTEIEGGLVLREPGGVLAAFGEPMYASMYFSPGSAPPYYRPLKVALASLVDHRFGREPTAFRSLNLAVGALTVALFAALVALLFRDLRAAGLAAAVVAAHPVGLESTVWISGLDVALARLFVVGSLLASIYAARHRGRARSVGSAAALGAFCLGLVSHEAAMVTPLLAGACVWVLRDSTEEPARTALTRFSLGLVGLQAVLGAAHWLGLRAVVLGGLTAGSQPIAGSQAVQLVTAIASWPDRIAWLFVPLRSTTSDVVRIVSDLLDPMFVMGLLLAGSVPWVFLRLARAGQQMAALGWVWIWIAFAPGSGIVPLIHARAERQLAISVFGMALLAAAVVGGVSRLAGPPGNASRTRTIVWAVVGLALVSGLGQRTSNRIPDWRSDLTLFGSDVAADPLFREGRYVLAVALAEQDRHREARDELTAIGEVNARVKNYTGFVRQDGVALLFCQLNLELGLESDTLTMMGSQLHPDSPALRAAPSLFLCGARTLERVGRANESLAILEGMRRVPGIGGDPRVLLGLARVQEVRGQRDAARGWLQKTPAHVAGDPSYSKQREALARALGPR